MALRLQDCCMGWEVLGLGFPLPPSQAPAPITWSLSLPFSLYIFPAAVVPHMEPAWAVGQLSGMTGHIHLPSGHCQGEVALHPTHGHREQQGLAVTYLMGEVSKLLGRTSLYPSAPPSRRNGCIVSAGGGTVCFGGLWWIVRGFLLTFSCPLPVLRMGKVEPGATLSNLETGIKEQLAGRPPWIKTEKPCQRSSCL